MYNVEGYFVLVLHGGITVACSDSMSLKSTPVSFFLKAVQCSFLSLVEGRTGKNCGARVL